VGSRYGDILPAEGHLFDLLEPEDVVPTWTHHSAHALVKQKPGRTSLSAIKLLFAIRPKCRRRARRSRRATPRFLACEFPIEQARVRDQPISGAAGFWTAPWRNWSWEQFLPRVFAGNVVMATLAWMIVGWIVGSVPSLRP
jgi:hypothetical protein